MRHLCRFLAKEKNKWKIGGVELENARIHLHDLEKRQRVSGFWVEYKNQYTDTELLAEILFCETIQKLIRLSV